LYTNGFIHCLSSSVFAFYIGALTNLINNFNGLPRKIVSRKIGDNRSPAAAD
jgi:hypothetical protein